MSTIYSLPLTNILVNGSKTYRLKTKDYDAILQHVEVESKTNDTINLNFEDLYFESIAFKGGSDLGETTLNCIRETMDVKNYYMVDSRPITCDESLKDEYLPELQFLVMRGYVIDIPMPGFATLDLNYQWRRSQTYDSPLEGYTLFESASNWHVGSGIAKCYLDVNGYDSGLIYYVAYGETNYDRLFIVGPNGETFTYPNSASPDNISNYKSTNFIDGRWSISYEKDGSVDREADRGYILIPNDISYSNEYVPVPITVDSISISGPDDITETGTYEFAATLQPSTADTYNLGWYIDDAPTGVVARIRWTADDPKRAYLEVDSIDEGVDSDITIVCYDDISGVEQSYNIRVRKEAQIYIQNIIISGPEQITNTGDYKYIVSYEPEDANKFNIDWDLRVPSGVTASILRGPTGDINGYLEVESIDPGVDATMEVICFDSVSGVEQSYSVNVKGEVIPIHIQNITISGPSQITEPGTYDYYATISPDNADEYDIDWDTIGFTDPHWYLQTDPEDPFHAQIVVPKTESFGSAFYLRCEDNVSFNYDRFSISMDVYVEPPVPISGNIYNNYPQSTSNVFDKDNLSWSVKTWNGLTSFNGNYIWTDGENVYYSSERSQYVLDKETDTWVRTTWNGLTSFDGVYVWTDGNNIYYSHRNGTQYVLDKETSTWITKTWNTYINGEYIWTDGTNIYYSDGYNGIQYILENGNWVSVTWHFNTSNGVIESDNILIASNVWTDGNNIYYSEGGDKGHYVFTGGQDWQEINSNASVNGTYIWTDGNNIYYRLVEHLNPQMLVGPGLTWTDIRFGGEKNSFEGLWSDNPKFSVHSWCRCTTFGRL